MKHLTFMCFLLCLFACSSEDIVSTVEESAKPANELTAQTVNLLDSLEIMEYIDSIISSFPKTRDHVTGYLLKDGWDYQLTEEQIELIRNSLPRPLFTQEKVQLQKAFTCVDYTNTVVWNNWSGLYNCYAYSMGIYSWIEFYNWDDLYLGYGNARAKYHAYYDYSDSDFGTEKKYPVIWSQGPTPLHASLCDFKHSNSQRSKMGQTWLLWHSSQGDINAEEIRKMHEATQENITISRSELAIISQKARAISKRSMFESLFNEWKEAWTWSFSSNTATTRQLPQYAELKAMGREIIPLLIEKMATEVDNFFAIRLYEDLQDDQNQKIRYANEDPHQFEGLQQTTKKTIKKWLEANSN